MNPSRVWVLLASALLAPCLAACQPSTASAPPTVLPAKRLSSRMPLAAYIPAPGIRWLIQLKPRALIENEAFRKDWEPVFGSERISAFRTASGFDPYQVEEIWIAGYDLGTLYLFDASKVGKAAESSFRDRSLTTSELSTKTDDLVHLTGMMNQVPHSFIHLDHYLVGIAEGDIRLTKIVAAYAEGRLPNTPSALQTRTAIPFANFAPDASVRAFALGPFQEATDSVVSGFVSGALAAHFTEAELRVSAKSFGFWPQDEQLESHLARWLSDVFGAPELRAFGWGAPLSLSPVECIKAQLDPEMSECNAKGSWNSAQIASAAHRITASSMAELVGPEPNRSGLD